LKRPPHLEYSANTTPPGRRDLGYSIEFDVHDDGRHVELTAFHQGRFAGSCVASIPPDAQLLRMEAIDVIKEHQRKGLATAMYVWAEHRTGFTFVPALNQTLEGRALWAQPNRPFGNPRRRWM
jgi:hypothetical protein